MCISAAGDEKRTHFFYDNDRGGTLVRRALLGERYMALVDGVRSPHGPQVGSLDEHGAGFVENHMSQRRAVRAPPPRPRQRSFRRHIASPPPRRSPASR